TTAAESILDERCRTQDLKGVISASRRQAPRLSCRAGVALLLLAAPRAALSAPPISKDGSTAAPAVQPPALTSEALEARAASEPTDPPAAEETGAPEQAAGDEAELEEGPPDELVAEQAPRAPRPPSEPPPSPARSKPLPFIELRPAFMVVTRSYGYEGEIRGALRRYELYRAMAVGASARLYPAAPFTKGFGANVGVFGWYERLLGLDSTVAGDELHTTGVTYGFGARVRVPVWRLELGAG